MFNKLKKFLMSKKKVQEQEQELLDRIYYYKSRYESLKDEMAEERQENNRLKLELMLKEKKINKLKERLNYVYHYDGHCTYDGSDTGTNDMDRMG